MRQKGFTLILVLFIIASIGIGAFYLKNKQQGEVVTNPSTQPVPEKTPVTSTTPTSSSKPQAAYFVSPKNGQEVIEGQNYLVELYFPDPNEVSKVEIGMGKLENPFNLYNLTQPPFKYLQKIPDPSYIAPYLAGNNSTYLVALVTYKSGAKETKSVKLNVIPPRVSIWFAQPERGKTFRPDEIIKIEAGINTPGETISKVEFFLTSQTLKTFTSPPYSFEYNLKNYCGGMSEQIVPLSVKATLGSGKSISDSTDVTCKI